jgi:TRAP-type C4-dicarboxylate transport system permease small subunit
MMSGLRHATPHGTPQSPEGSCRDDVLECPVNSDPETIGPAAEPGAGSSHPMQAVFNMLAAVGTVWIFFLMLLVVADVVGRNFLDKPITGVAEFAARSVAAIVFLQLPAAIGAGKMTKSDFLQRILSRRSPRAVAVMESVFAALAALLFLALAWISWPEWISSWKGNEYFGVQGVYMIPTWPFRGLLVAGSIMAAVAYVLTIPRLLRSLPPAVARS